MNRIFILFLSVVFVFSVLAFPVSAAEIYSDSQRFLNILDFSSNRDSGNNYLYFTGSYEATYALPSRVDVNYIDLVVQCAGAKSVTVTAGPTGNYTKQALNVVQIASYTYRVYGRITTTVMSSLSIIFDTGQSSTPSAYTITSLKIGLLGMDATEIEAYCDIGCADYNATIHYVPTDTINNRIWQSDTTYANSYMHLRTYVDDWYKYDFIDVYINVSCHSIQSVSCSAGGVAVPISVSPFDNGNMILNDFTLVVTMDLRELDRSGSMPILLIECTAASQEYNSVFFYGCVGRIEWINIDPLNYWLQKISVSISGGFANVQNWILTQTNSIVSVLRGDSSSGDQFKSDSSGLISDLDDISSSLDSVNRPSLDNVDTDYSGDISDASMLLSNIFTEITAVSWLSRIILASVTMGLIAYILYGKE